MIPFTDFTYWGVLAYPALPTLLVAWSRRLRQLWILLATLGMLAVQYSAVRAIGAIDPLAEVWLVLAFAVYEYAVAATFLIFRQRTSLAGWPAVLLALGPLVTARVPATHTLVAFLGISYVTFRSLDVILAIHDRAITSLRPDSYLAYVLFFPTISSGPIDRFRRFLQDWHSSRTRAQFFQDIDAAIHHVFTGFLYKFVLAELIRRYWLDPATSMPGLFGTLSYMYAYSLFLFFDFAGYTAFAVGVSSVFGIHPPENFRRPFLARDIKDFWNRWHISLSWWLRDHVYIRFVMAATKGRWLPDRYLTSYVGFLVSMGLMGLWHGSELRYITYGLYHAALLIGHDLFTRWNRRHPVWGTGPVWHAAAVVVTIQFVCFGFLIFSGHLGF